MLILVARQQGKTHLLKVLSLFWQFIERWPLIISSSTNLAYAIEAWEHAVRMAEGSEILSPFIPVNGGVRRTNGEQCLTTTEGCRHKIAASNRKGGRSLSIDRLILDELREHRSWDAWNAAVPATNARPSAQIFCISNQGDDESIVLNSLRDSALQYMSTGEGDHRLGLFEYSAPDGCELDDIEGWAQSNPNLGRRMDLDTIASAAKRAAIAGGEEEAGFRTEVLCQRVRKLDAAIDPSAWERCREVGDLSEVRNRIALCVDISPDGLHATLAAAGLLDDGRVRVEVVAAWDGAGATKALRSELSSWIERIKPKVLGWFPAGPAAVLVTDLRTAKADTPQPKTRWEKLGVKVSEIKSEVDSTCMGFAEQVLTGQIIHSGDPLLDSHVTGAEKLRVGDSWRFSRRGGGHCDAAYAAAGAVHLARTLPAPIGKIRIIRPASREAA